MGERFSRENLKAHGCSEEKIDEILMWKDRVGNLDGAVKWVGTEEFHKFVSENAKLFVEIGGMKE